ncbi:MAG: hypothetical protein K6C35_00535 [Eubacterium sp.]|nr:hypothetical protein [Eubacterium sp.]
MKNKMKKLIARMALVFTALIPLTGCGSNEKTSEKSSDSGAKTEGTSTPGKTEDSSTEADPAKSGLTPPASAVKASEKADVYDYSALLPEKENMTLEDLAVTNDGKLLLLYETNDFSEGEPYFSLVKFDPTDGASENIKDDIKLTLSDEYDMHHYMRIIDRDQIIIYDCISYTFYDLTSGTSGQITLSEDEYAAKFFSYKGDVCFSSTTGKLYILKEAGDAFSTEVLWEPAPAYDLYELWEFDGEYTTFSAAAYWSNTISNVLLKVDLSTGEITEAYDYANYYPSRTGYLSNDALLTQDYDEATFTPCINARFLKDNTQYSLPISSEYVSENLFLSGGISLKFGEFPFGYDGIFFPLITPDYVNHLIYWKFSENEKKEYTPESLTPHEVVNLTDEYLENYKKELEDRLGLRIYLKDDASNPPVDDYDVVPEYKLSLIYGALLTIDECYSRLPDGFLQDLMGTNPPLRIYIVNDITGNAEGTIESANGLRSTDLEGDFIILASLNTKVSYETLMHETGHIIFNKLVADDFINGYDNDEWDEYNPSGFEYALSYTKEALPDNIYTPEEKELLESYENIYFCRAYSKTYKTGEISG